MRHLWRHLNLGSKHIVLNIRMVAANTLNTCTVPFPSASAELRRFINRLVIIIIIILPEVRVIPQDLKKIRDNFFVLGWLVFDDVSAKSAMKSKCVETLDGNRYALVEECSLPAVTSNLCEAVANIIKEIHAFVIDGAKSFEGQGHKTVCR